MVTLTLTPSRTADVLLRAAHDLTVRGWHPIHSTALAAIDRACDYRRPGDLGEDVTLAAWEAWAACVGVDDPQTGWEQRPGRTAAEVVAALRTAASGVTAMARPAVTSCAVCSDPCPPGRAHCSRACRDIDDPHDDHEPEED